MLKNINKPAFAVIILYPILIFILAFLYVKDYQFGAKEIVLCVVGYYGSNISVGVGLHRLWSHGAFKTNKFVEFFFALFTAGTLQGPVLAWCSDHYKHHSYTDEQQDPHNSQKYKSKIKSFLWSHAGWMISGNEQKAISRVTIVKLGRNKVLTWQMKYYWHIAIFMNIVLPMLIGYAIWGSYFGAYVSFLFIGLGRAIQQQATFCVNSLCHVVGKKTYQKGTAGDIWWMMPFLLGENWHNFHHAFPSDYRNGHKWYQLDVHKWIIYIMSKVGLAHSLISTTEARVKIKMIEAAK